MKNYKNSIRWLATTWLCLWLLSTGTATATQEVAQPFQDFYNQHHGMRVLGSPITGLVISGNYLSQYFEKGRIEDHAREVMGNPAWMFMYGRLTAEMMDNLPQNAVNSTTTIYAELKQKATPANRHSAPDGFVGGIIGVGGNIPALNAVNVTEGVFIPYDSQLGPSPGYYVPGYFWRYFNQLELFPGGWLHDIGLPMTDPFHAETYKNGQLRYIIMQAFERTVLTYDPQNPAEWQVERGNLGSDALRVTPQLTDISIPASGAKAILPLHLMARVGQPGERVVAELRWQDGTVLSDIFTLLRGEDGKGLLIDTLNWKNEGPPPNPPTQPAVLEIRNQDGVLLSKQAITILNGNDPAVTQIKLYYILGDDRLQAFTRRIPATEQIGRAALEELLWGPAPSNLAGATTALPTPQQVLSYPGGEADWGPRVTVRSLNINQGVATADFSQEMKAYGGGSLRVKLIRDQITQTLLQFPTVQTVNITIEGQSEGVLEP